MSPLCKNEFLKGLRARALFIMLLILLRPVPWVQAVTQVSPEQPERLSEERQGTGDRGDAACPSRVCVQRRWVVSAPTTGTPESSRGEGSISDGFEDTSH